MWLFLKHTGLCILLVLLVSSCSTVSDSEWWGKKEDDRLEGKRISIIDTNKTLTPDVSAADVSIQLTPSIINDSWPLVSQTSSPHLPLKLRVTSSFEAGESSDDSLAMPATPVIEHNMLYAIDAEKTVRAYQLDKNNTILWEKSLAKDEDTLPGGGLTYYKGTLYVSLGYNHIFALDAHTGETQWKRAMNGIVRSAPTVGFNHVVVTTIDNQTYALHPKSGNIQWIHSGIRETTSTLGSAAAALHENIAIIPHSSGEVYAVTTYDGKELWSDNIVYNSVSSFTLSDIDTMPIIDGNRVYINSYSGLLVAFELYTGEKIWQREIRTLHSPWVNGNVLYTITDDAQLVCLLKETGAIKWVTQLPRYEDMKRRKGHVQWTRPLVAHDYVWTVSSDGTLMRVDATTGNVLDRIEVEDNITLAPMVAHSKLYLLDNNANITILE